MSTCLEEMAMALTENIFVAAAAKPSLQSSSWRDGRAGGEGRVGARMQRCMPATNLPFQSFAISAVFLFRPQPKRGFSIICQPVRREHARDAGNSGMFTNTVCHGEPGDHPMQAMQGQGSSPPLSASCLLLSFSPFSHFLSPPKRGPEACM